MWQSFGHTANKQLLEKNLESGVFAHAYLFAGPVGLGKCLIAGEFAAKLLKTQNLSRHPDFTQLSLPGELGVETIRDFLSQLKVKPFFGQWKVAVLDNAQNLTQASANALLKSLEEPSPSTILMLIAERLKLPKTLISRCQVLTFHRLPQSELAKYAENLDLRTDTETLALSFGSPGRLKTLLKDAEKLGQLKLSLQKLGALASAPEGEKLLAVGEFAQMEAEILEELLLCWLYTSVKGLAKQPLEYRAALAIMRAYGSFRLNLNKKMVLQRLFLSL